MHIENLKWLRLWVIASVLVAAGTVAEAQHPAKVPRIGIVGGGDPSNPGPNVEAFRQGLRDLGYIEGKNILVEYRYHEGKVDRIPSFVAELVQLKVDVLVLGIVHAIRAAKQATKTIPIVMVTTADPVSAGLVDSLARPGGNITGLTRLTRELRGKRLELLKEVVPTISRVGVLWRNTLSTGPTTKTESTADAIVARPGSAVKEYEAAAPALKLQVQSLEVRGPNPDLEVAFQAAAKGRANGLVTILNPLLNHHQKQIADLAMKNRLPSMFESNSYVEAGGLMSYSANDTENYRRAATYVDKILKGTKPADLPVEQPTKFELVINLKTAKQIDLTIPPNVLARADRVIR
jgi:putative ABC transport system substrate-binding protein